MVKVIRYDFIEGSYGSQYFEPNELGSYVEFDDYSALEIERDALRAELNNQDRTLRSSVPEEFKGATSPVGAVQGYIAELEHELKEKTSNMIGVGDGSGKLFVYGDYDSIKAVQALILQGESDRAELEKAKDKLGKAQELAEWHHSHQTFAESQLEAARKQEPCGYMQQDAGITTIFNASKCLGDFSLLAPVYASPVPAQQPAEVTQNTLKPTGEQNQ